MRYIVDDAAFTIEPLAGEQAGRAISWFDDAGFALLSRWWTQASWQRKYSYQFRWLGRPIIQLPADVLLIQELIFRMRPTVIIETGIAHGGSVVLHASLLRLVHGDDSPAEDRPHVVAIDIEIRPDNRHALQAHPLRDMFTLIEGSSIDRATIAKVRGALRVDDRIMVVLDSNHSREHVLAELHAYAPLVSPGCALVVMDTIMPELANLPAGSPQWSSDHPAAAIVAFEQSDGGHDFIRDPSFDGHALTHSPGGVLVRREEAHP